MVKKELPCTRETCIECCLETEMPLSNDDVERIADLGFDKVLFIAESDGWRRLKNAGGRCVFHDGESCRIYDNRPEGCRLYPIVWDEDEEKAKVDWVCPHSEEFGLDEDSKRELSELVERLKKERDLRVEE
jgi:uncharacterized protein